jgi:hypothetical protein
MSIMTIVITMMRRNRVWFFVVLWAFVLGGAFLWVGSHLSDEVTPERKELVVDEEVSDAVISAPEMVEALKSETLLPSSFSIPDVPFTVQAPLRQWQDPTFQDACEEASLIMVVAWVRGDTLTREGVTSTIGTLALWQKPLFGHSVDTSITDTAKILDGYYDMTGAVQTEVTIEDIKRALASNRLVIVPTDGRKLKNPNFTQPGPPRHMLVIVGYDDVTGEFIVNDPGTRKGAGYRYGQDVLYEAILDYPTGNHLPAPSMDKVMLVVGRE